MTGRVNLEMFGRLYHLSGRDVRQRARALLERFDLSDAANRVVKTYSGGMRRRLDLAASLLVAPPVLFLDEPTTGLDPRGRSGMWEVIAGLVADGTTVLLTTQYLEEADHLATTIVVVDHGRVIARGTADELKARVGGERLEVTIACDSSLGAALATFQRYAESSPHVEKERRRVVVPISNGARLLASIIRDLDDAGVALDDLALRRPTLDDVFLALTGHEAEPQVGDPEDADATGPRGRVSEEVSA